jgi:hypothetical protein
MNNLFEQAAATPPDDSTRLIPLTQGKFAVVDAADYEWLSQWKWYASYQRTTGRWYAYRASYIGKKKYNIAMHRVILNAPHGLKVDHVDGDGLHNRHDNIRLATICQNRFNRGPQRNNTSGIKGVSWNKETGKWQAFIGVNGKQTHLGLFVDKLDAAAAYAEAAKRLHGEFSRIEPFKRSA